MNETAASVYHKKCLTQSTLGWLSYLCLSELAAFPRLLPCWSPACIRRRLAATIGAEFRGRSGCQSQGLAVAACLEIWAIYEGKRWSHLRWLSRGPLLDAALAL